MRVFASVVALGCALIGGRSGAEEKAAAPQVEKPAALQTEQATVPEEGGWKFSLQAGSGYDSNVLRSATGPVGASTWMVRGGVLGRPLPRLSLRLTGGLIAPLGVASLAESDLTLVALYRVLLGRYFSVALSSLSSWHRGITVFTEAGTILPPVEDPGKQQLVLLRSELAEHLEPALQFSPGSFDAAVGVRLDLKSVWGAENYGLWGLGPTVAVRWMLNTRFSGRVRYAYTLRSFDGGLRGRNPYGAPLPIPGRTLQLGVHEVGPNLHLRLADALTLQGSYTLELYSDNFLGFLDGLAHAGQLGAELEVGKLEVEAAVAVRQRSFTVRRVSPREPRSETSVGGRLEASYFFTSILGVFVRYELDLNAADPTGLLYVQHLVMAGPAARLGFGGK